MLLRCEGNSGSNSAVLVAVGGPVDSSHTALVVISTQLTNHSSNKIFHSFVHLSTALQVSLLILKRDKAHMVEFSRFLPSVLNLCLFS